MATLDSHYGKIIEGDRLFSSRANSIEFHTTCHFIEKYLKPASRKIGLGAGHGAYSYDFSLKSHAVLAIDIVGENIETIEKLIETGEGENLSCLRLDATDMGELSRFGLSPLCHIAADGSYTLFRDRLEEMSEEAFADLLEYHIRTAGTPSGLGVKQP